MKLPNKVVSWGLVAGFAFAMGISTGCTRHPSEEQLRALEETKQAALSAEQTAEQCKRDKADLERQLEQKKRDLQKANDEKEAVKRRLGL